MQEIDKNPFPTIDLFPRMTAIGRFLGDFVLHRHSEIEVPERGAEAFLCEQLEFDYES